MAKITARKQERKLTRSCSSTIESKLCKETKSRVPIAEIFDTHVDALEAHQDPHAKIVIRARVRVI